MGHGPPPHGREVDEGRFLTVLSEAIAALEDKGIAHLVMGGISSAELGRPRGTNDIDLFVRPESARLTLEALAAASFTTEETDPRWLFKAFKDDIMVDVIFRSTGDIYLDEEMLSRSRVEEFKGQPVRVLAPEDLLVIKAVVHDEKTPRHWYDALGIIGHSDLDWDYLLRRARRAARRVLSLLLYAQSNDILVPQAVVRELFEMISEPAPERKEPGLLPMRKKRRSV
jgi:predicted nucleotidyltransferase